MFIDNVNYYEPLLSYSSLILLRDSDFLRNCHSPIAILSPVCVCYGAIDLRVVSPGLSSKRDMKRDMNT